MRNKTLVENRSPQSTVRSPQSNGKGNGRLVTSPGKEVSRETPEMTRETRVLPPGKWAEYLAGKPEEKEFQLAVIAQIREKFETFSREVSDLVQRKVSTAEMSRQIGLLVNELEQKLPGKKLTEDFWRQMESLFVTSTGKKIAKDDLLWCAKVAKHHPEEIKSIQDVQKVQQLVLSAGGFVLESERAPQISHVPESPVSLLRERLNFQRIEEVWTAVRSDQNYFRDGRLRPDLRETLRVELEPTIRIVLELKNELEL